MSKYTLQAIVTFENFDFVYSMYSGTGVRITDAMTILCIEKYERLSKMFLFYNNYNN